MPPFLLIFPWVVVAGLSLWILRSERARRQGPADHAMVVNELINSNMALSRISQAVEHASDAIGIGDMNGQSVYHNQAHLALFGYSVNELNALPNSGVLFADETVAREIHATIRQGHSWVGETDVLTCQGRRIPAFVRADIIRNAEHEPIGIFGVFTDITERRRIESSLDAERQRLAITLQSMGDAVIATSANGQIALVNRVAAQLTGWSQEEANQIPLNRIFSLLDETTRTPIDLFASGRAESTGEITGLLITRNGQELTISAKATPLNGTAGKVVLFRDITAERHSAAERERANKVESLGMMAGGIAHDFANVLTAIMAHLSLAQVTDNLPTRAAASLKEATLAAWRARDLTQQLLVFARGGNPDKQLLVLDQVIHESLALSLHSTPDITVQYEIVDDLWPTLIDPGQMGQVMSNLMINAAQAMKDRGTLTLVARNLPPGHEQGPALSAVPVVYVGIRDDGPGIPPENLAKIFDPFFSTKKTGTGLGLATVYSVVTKHGGRIRVDSTVGRGTTFHLYFPAVRQQAANVLEAAAAIELVA